MHSHWYPLIGKEWHAHKWKLASLAFILMTIHVWVLVDAALAEGSFLGGRREMAVLLGISIVFCAAPGALFVGMGVAAGERSADTYQFLRALPVAPWKVAAAKLLMAALTVVVPIALIVVVDQVWFGLAARSGDLAAAGVVGGRSSEPLADIKQTGLVSSGLALSILLWSAVAGTGQRTELRAGIAAVAVLAIWGVATYALGTFVDKVGRWNGTASVPFWAIFYLGPAGLFALFNPNFPYAHAAIPLQLLALCGLTAWFLYRASRPGIDISRAGADFVRSILGIMPQDGEPPTALNPPRQAPLMAIGWKQWRESLPICLCGLLPVATIAVVTGFCHLLHPFRPSVTLVTEFVETVAGSALFLGMVVAMVVGIGTFVTELQPGLLTFWRSRPISPTLWFWTKYLTGALAVLLLIDGPIAVVTLFAHSRLVSVASGSDLMAYLVCAPLLHLLTYSSAVCLACLVREAVYAGILTVGVVLYTFLAPELVQSLAWLRMSAVMRDLAHTSGSLGLLEFARIYLPFFAVLTSLSVIAALAAWQAVVRDISAKR